MSVLDWIVLLGTLGFIVIYGVWKTRGSKNIESYLLGDKSMKWWTIGLSVMATQASAITFLSTPGQAYGDGMGFIQFYLGMPLAIIVICAVIIPIYHRLKVYTAYEYLEGRFDVKTRYLGAFLFLVQRGLQAGITIYAPAIVLSTILSWPLSVTILIIGILVIIYTVSGGTKAVSQTQKQQMLVILAGMAVAFYLIIDYLPDTVTFTKALDIAGNMGKMNVLNYEVDFSTKFTLWNGLIGGAFLALSYFGTDQSQVQRYLSGKSIKEMRLGLIFNAILKIPMQFFILLTGVMVFIFFQFERPPMMFNEADSIKIENSQYADSFKQLENTYYSIHDTKKQSIEKYVGGETQDFNAIKQLQDSSETIKAKAKSYLLDIDPDNKTKEKDYVFISFILKYLPKGIVGLLLAVIFSAAMSSTAGELNALASTTVVDFYKRKIKPSGTDVHYLRASKLFTLMWGVIAILFAMFATMVDNLIVAVNYIGSIFYGTVLGIFVVAFFIKRIHGNAVFWAALIAQAIVIMLDLWGKELQVEFLWYNVIGCILVMVFALILNPILPRPKKA